LSALREFKSRQARNGFNLLRGYYLQRAPCNSTGQQCRFIFHRIETAIANHEFQKARFYSDEERKERDNLRALNEKYHLSESAVGVVGPEDIEAVISRWTGISVDAIRQGAADAQDDPGR